MHFVKNFRGNLLYIHGTGDDNIHYQNAELLINEMIKITSNSSLCSSPTEAMAFTKAKAPLYTFPHSTPSI
jgi:dipeptidyl-peptidase-4